MGVSLQCDLSFSTVHIGDKVIKVNRQPRVTRMIKENIETDVTYFLYADINSFRDELIFLEKEELIPLITQEVFECFDLQGMCTMYFDGAN